MINCNRNIITGIQKYQSFQVLLEMAVIWYFSIQNIIFANRTKFVILKVYNIFFKMKNYD